MMQIVPEWEVEVTLSDGEVKKIWVADTFASNVLRTVSNIKFARFPIDVIEVKIKQPEKLTNQAYTQVFANAK